MMRRNTLESIMKYVARCSHGDDCSACCWLWTGQTDSRGEYGKVSYVNEKHIAHSLIFKLHTYKGQFVKAKKYTNHLHTCDTPLCCNWNHIYEGTHQQNMQDKVMRNRQCKGEAQLSAKLNDSKVYQIRRNRYAGWELYELAYFFDVSISTVNKILAWQDWKHLRGELQRCRCVSP